MEPRRLRPEDVYAAATWLYGIEPRHGAGWGPRRLTEAKHGYWAALHAIGLSVSEIARQSNAAESTVKDALKKDNARVDSEAILARARRQVELAEAINS